MDIQDLELCSKCVALVNSICNDTDGKKDRPHYADYEQLLKSSKECWLCRSFIVDLIDSGRGMKRFGEYGRPEVDGYTFSISVLRARRMSSGIIWAHFEIYLRSTISIRAFAADYTLTICLDEATATNLPFWQTSCLNIDQRISAAASFYQRCSASHDHAQKVNYRRPKRLISVGKNQPLQLIETSELPSHAQYAALSYCWGSNLLLKTTRRNIARFSGEICAASLPRTYSDFINIVRALDIPYVWIDALCIVQDDEDEWQGEAARMGDIFQGSRVTIAALQSKDTSKGCFPSPQKLGNERGFQRLFKVRQSSLANRSILLRLYEGDIRSHGLRESVMSSRGWTLQEQILSPRSILLMENEVHWQCNMCYGTQSGLEFSATEMMKSSLGLGLPLSISKACTQEEDFEYRHIWRCIAESYSLRSFTYEKDRLPAIAGITKHMAKILDDTPILGLWKNSFAFDLGWMVTNNPGDTPAPENPTLPSWTWLKWPCDLWYTWWDYGPRRKPMTPLTKLMMWHVQWTGIPYVSPIEHVRIQVKGPLREISFTPSEYGNQFSPPYLEIFGEHVEYKEQTQTPWRAAGRLDHRLIEGPSTYICLLLWVSILPEFRAEECFLMLEPVEDSKEDIPVYRRVGMGKIWGDTANTFDHSNPTTLLLI
ncbi:HET-domain-containing protein [Xylariaceae sp. FL1272]|nr:HET-domain-containing protein [Xylariaceae sp. FL1272]